MVVTKKQNKTKKEPTKKSEKSVGDIEARRMTRWREEVPIKVQTSKRDLKIDPLLSGRREEVSMIRLGDLDRGICYRPQKSLSV